MEKGRLNHNPRLSRPPLAPAAGHRAAAFLLAAAAAATLLLAACSTTSNLPEGEILYTGIKQTDISDRHNTYAESVALTEVEGALAYAPNNSFMGSSSIRMWPPVGLWIYNSMVNKEHSGFGKWMLNTFGSTPVTIAMVNPETRVKVATNTLQNYGYFRGYVTYDLISQRNPRKQKISYHVKLGEPYLLDSIRYAFGPRGEVLDSIVTSHFDQRLLRQDDQFSVPNLESEQNRISSDLRDHGFYYYRPDYVRFFADSMQTPQRVKLLVMHDDQAPARATRQFRIGNIHTYVRSAMQTSRSQRKRTGDASADTLATDTARRRQQQSRFLAYDDSTVIGPLKYAWQGGRQPIKPRVLFRNYTFKPGELFSQSQMSRTMTNLSNMQVFQQLQFSYTPRDTLSACDTIDVRIDAMMDRLIDTEIDFGFTQKSNAQVGPNASLELTKRNAFGHGETFSVGLKGSYEWQTGNRATTTNQRPDSWEAGLDVSLGYPWLAFPGLYQKYFKYSTSSQFKLSIDNLKRAGYYRLVSFGAEATYNFQTSKYVTHQFTPISITYNRLMQTSARFDSIVASNSSLYISMRNQLIPAMQYVFTYDNSANTALRRTTRFTAQVKESGNLLGGIYALGGKSWGERDKTLLGTPFSQFLKVSLELCNKFYMTDKSLIATRLQAGTVWSYGNSRYAPYSELFYAGGVNSIRAFGVRTIGPGRYYDSTGRGTFLDQSGDLKLEANVEYRFPVISNLYGAIFVDAGNVWMLRDDSAHPGGTLEEGSFLESIALGTGVGLRYDMEFLVLRLDLGIGLHCPYDTGKDSYYNIPKFSDGLGLHFAVGYPF